MIFLVIGCVRASIAVLYKIGLYSFSLKPQTISKSPYFLSLLHFLTWNLLFFLFLPHPYSSPRNGESTARAGEGRQIQPTAKHGVMSFSSHDSHMRPQHPSQRQVMGVLDLIHFVESLALFLALYLHSQERLRWSCVTMERLSPWPGTLKCMLGWVVS